MYQSVALRFSALRTSGDSTAVERLHGLTLPANLFFGISRNLNHGSNGQVTKYLRSGFIETAVTDKTTKVFAKKPACGYWVELVQVQGAMASRHRDSRNHMDPIRGVHKDKALGAVGQHSVA